MKVQTTSHKNNATHDFSRPIRADTVPNSKSRGITMYIVNPRCSSLINKTDTARSRHPSNFCSCQVVGMLRTADFIIKIRGVGIIKRTVLPSTTTAVAAAYVTQHVYPCASGSARDVPTETDRWPIRYSLGPFLFIYERDRGNNA